MVSHINLPHSHAFWITYLFFMMIPPAHSAEKIRDHTITPPPSCVNNKEETVVFENVVNGQADNAAGIAKRDEINGGRDVVL